MKFTRIPLPQLSSSANGSNAQVAKSRRHEGNSRTVGRGIQVLLLLLTLLLPLRWAHAATVNVTSTADAGPNTLRQTIADAAPGDTIMLTVTGVISLKSELVIQKRLTIIGPTASSLSVKGGSNFRVFDVASAGSLTLYSIGIVGTSGSTSAIVEGGGIYNEGVVYVGGCEFTGCVAQNGGGLYNDGDNATATIQGCTFSGNYSIFEGGAIRNRFGSTLVMNSTFSDNTTEGYGGGIYLGSGSVNVVASTISGNNAEFGGGICDFGSATLQSTIVAANSATDGGPDVYSSFTSKGHNLIGNVSGGSGFGANGDLVGNDGSPIDPQLGILANNGGSTRTMALALSSPAVDAGDDTVLLPPYSLTTDQRGLSRQSGAHVDIGAVEGQATTLTSVKVTNLADSGPGSLRDALAKAGGGDTITLAIHGTLKLYTGELLVNKQVFIVGPGANQLTIDGQSLSRVFNVPAFGVTITGVTVLHGSTVATGGGINNTGDLTLTGCTFVSNSAATGGGISNDGTLTLNTCKFTQNNANLGGAIGNNGTLNIRNCTIDHNSANTSGGGLSNNNVAYLIASTFSNNAASDTGGGVVNNGYLNLLACTLSGNRANQGGGIYNNFGSLTVRSCTIVGNMAGFQGGGIWSPPTTSSFSNAILRNTIVARNTAGVDGPDLFGGYMSNGFNLIGNSSGSTGFTDGLNGDQVGTQGHPIDPKVGALADNGGPTLTIALLPGSPAVDTGDNTTPFDFTTDQRGEPRFHGQGDIGSYEAKYGASIAIGAATGITGSSAILHARVNSNGGVTVVKFYVNTSLVGSVTLSDKTEQQTASVGVYNLKGHTGYTYYVTATSNGVTSTSYPSPFTTLDNPPWAKDVTVIATGTSVSVNLANYIGDPDGDKLTITIGGNVVRNPILFEFPEGLVTSSIFPYKVTDAAPYKLSNANNSLITILPETKVAAPGTHVIFSGTSVKVGAQVSGSGVIVNIGIPAINDAGQIVVKATLRVTGTAAAGRTPPTALFNALLVGDSSALAAITSQTQRAPDTTGTTSIGTFANFGDPVIDAGGYVAFVARIVGPGVIADKNDRGIWTNAPQVPLPAGTLHLVRRTSDSPFGVALAKIASFQAISLLGDDSNTELVYKATLIGSGTTRVQAGNDSGMWSQGTAGSASETLLVREGVSQLSGTTIKSFNALTATIGPAGQARAHVTPGIVLFNAVLKDGTTQAIVEVATTSGSLTAIAVSGTAGTPVGSLFLPEDAKWTSYGSPILDGSYTQLAFRGTCQTLGAPTQAHPHGVLTNWAGIFAGGTTSAPFAFEPVALVGGTANDMTGTPKAGWKFTAFQNPVLDDEGTSLAFVATISGVVPTRNSGIWWTGASGTPALVAQTGTPYPAYLPGGVTFQSFNSLALPPGGTGGPIFVATLAGGGVTAANNHGLVVVDQSGTPSLVLRTGIFIGINGNTKTLKAFDVIGFGTAPSTPGVTRSFNSNQQIIYRATFMDGTQAVLMIGTPIPG